MGDQGAGSIDSPFMSGHARTKSDNEAGTADASVEAGSSQGQQEDSEPFATSQQHPRSAETRETGQSPSVSIHLSQRRRLEPPVTKATLSELDVNKIIHNPKLRHDINFDPELHFRPNLDGEKGRRKQEKANQFWSSLGEELMLFVMDREEFARRYGQDDDWCLPSLLNAVRDIIQTLVPARDRELLAEGLNVELLMQQFNRGILDLEKLASWLSSVLKLHCAPMRDEWVDEMYHELSHGNRTNDMGELVKGMRSLLSVLEAMKLDVANHQIRCLRPLLIEDTVHFERRFFDRKITLGRLDVGPAREWYQGAVEAYPLARGGRGQDFGEMGPFFEALCKLLLPSVDVKDVPNTFLFDEDRILKLRSDMFDAIYLDIGMRVFEQIEYPMQRPAPLPAYVAEDEPSLRTRTSAEFNFAAPSSRPSSIGFGSCDSARSSPRSSANNLPFVDFAEAKARYSTLYSSLVALLHTAQPGMRPVQRWESLRPLVAVQIFRSLNSQQHSPADVERVLEKEFRAGSRLRAEAEKCFLDRLLSEVGRRVKEFKHLSGVALFSVATGGRIHGPGRTWDGGRDNSGQLQHGLLDSSLRGFREDGDVEDMATRLAHLGILHWRVWAGLAYVPEADREDSLGNTTHMGANVL